MGGVSGVSLAPVSRWGCALSPNFRANGQKVQTACPMTIRTQSQAAELLGMTRQSFAALTKEDGFPEKGKDGWKASEIVGFYIDARTKSPEFEAARARRMAADARRLEILVAEKEKRVVEMADVERDWSGQVTRLRDVVEKENNRLAPKLSGLDAPGILVELKAAWRRIQETVAKSHPN